MVRSSGQAATSASTISIGARNSQAVRALRRTEAATRGRGRDVDSGCATFTRLPAAATLDLLEFALQRLQSRLRLVLTGQDVVRRRPESRRDAIVERAGDRGRPRHGVLERVEQLAEEGI